MARDDTRTATVSVIVPTFNRAEYLAASLDSILEQSHAPAQVIVVDDGSTDDTPRVLQRYADRITVLRKSNAGKSAAINDALPHAQGKYLWVFDDDDVACADALARHLRVLERRPELAFTYSGAYRCVNGRGADVAMLEVVSTNPVRSFPEDEYFIELLMSPYAGSPAVLVRKRIQDAAGQYATDLPRSQDFDMALRWALHGPAARLDDPTPTFYRRFHDGLRGPQQNRFSYSRNTALSRQAERIVLRRLDPMIPLRRYLPASSSADAAAPEWEAAALVRRLAVRVRRGMWPEVVLDLETLSSHSAEQLTACAASRHYLRSAIARIPAVTDMLDDRYASAVASALLMRKPLRVLRSDLLRGLYWLTREQVGAGEWSAAKPCLAAAWQLLGIHSRQFPARFQRKPRG